MALGKSRRERPLIAFCLDNGGIGGTELNALRTAERLVTRGWNVEVLALSRHRELIGRYERAGIPVHVFSMPSLASRRAFTEGLRLRRFLSERGVQLFHAHDIYGNLFGVPWARLAGVPVVLASRRWWKHEIRRGHHLANGIAYRLASAVVANSERVAAVARTDAGGKTPVVVVPNFVDDDAFQDLEPRERADLLRTFGVPDSRVVIGCVANLRPVKDHATLLHAAARVAGDGYDIHVVLIGDGELRADLTRLAKQLRICDRVTFAGAQPPTPNHHRLFDIATLTSTDEAFSNSILEGMAAAKPVAATSVGGIPDAVVDRETGLLVPPKEPAALAAALVRLISDPALASRMGRAGRQRVRRHFSARSALQALTNLYTSLLNGRRTFARGAEFGATAGASVRGNL